MAESATAVDVARQIADSLEADGIPYAVGGAIALGFYTVPRATVDVDINIFVAPRQDLARALGSLRRAGFDPDADDRTVAQQAIEEGQFRGYVEGLRVDVFVPALDYYGGLAGRRREVQLLGRPAWVLGPEDLTILKMMFYRRKDLADVESLLRDHSGSLDLAFVEKKLIELVGEQDERIAALRKIATEVSG